MNNIAPSATTKTLTISDENIITIGSHQFASELMIQAPYKAMDVFISEELESDFTFTSVGGSWQEITPEGTHLEAEIRTQSDGEWSSWTELEEEEDAFATADAGSQAKYAMASTNGAQKIQYKFVLYGDGNRVPVVKNVEWTFINAAKNPRPKASIQPKFAAATTATAEGNNNLLLMALETSNLAGVVSRNSWGANESLRYMDDNTLEPVLVDVTDSEFYEKYKDELRFSKVVEGDENGNKYLWPLQYPEKVKKFVIHHTATTSNLDNPEQAIRDIYYYHTVSRGWGDIGYNYVVDQQGTVYEGRFGGEGVIGAHSGPGNNGSIGIAMLGNYQDNPIPEETIVKLSQFIYKKAKIHGIAAEGVSTFRGKNMANIFGHRDIMSTACPGEFLYQKIPVIRSLASERFNLKDKFVKDYDFQDQSEIYYLEMKPEQTLDVSLKLQNIGKVAWDNQTYLELEEMDDFMGVVSFPGKAASKLAMISESSVQSGDSATFNFQIKSHSKAKTVYLNLKPVINGTNSTSDELVIPLNIEQPVYKYELVEMQKPASLIKAGTSLNGSIKLKNNGNVSWSNSTISLKSYTFEIEAKLQESEVRPGETGTFSYSFDAPDFAGYYKEIFSPQMTGATWISKDELSFDLTVYEREYHGELLSKDSSKEWEQGKNYTLSVNIRNIGIKSWSVNDLKASVVRQKGLSMKNLKMVPATVQPGETSTMSFTVAIAADQELSENVLLVRPLINGKRVTTKPLYFQYKITEAKLQTQPDEAQDQIRIKLGFTGEPEITANGTFDVYAGNNLLTTLSAGDTVAVSRDGDKYRLQAEDSNFLESDFPRFIPKTNAILKIKNFEHRPSWNQDLNDNEYRGNLEVRTVEGTLIVINELYLEDYLKGLGEVSNSEHTEKIKAIMVAARSYAEFYIKIDEKFPGKPYNLDDNPDVSQKYLGYGLEKRAPNIAEAIDETKGEVIYYEGKLVKTPYFNLSDGMRTKSAKEVWGWTTTPYLVSVDDSSCTTSSGTFSGHGVGLSGCGAKGMAESGKTYQEILKHYYTGITIEDLY
ncbi:MAG: N-acetylmuramoyl-L-alanine amidase [Patescibacteria group bacterium]